MRSRSHPGRGRSAAASSLVRGEPLGRRELERPRELARDLSRSHLDQEGRVNPLLDGVQVARLGGDEPLRVSARVHPQPLSNRSSRAADGVSGGILIVPVDPQLLQALVKSIVSCLGTAPGCPCRTSNKRRRRTELRLSAGRRPRRRSMGSSVVRAFVSPGEARRSHGRKRSVGVGEHGV